MSTRAPAISPAALPLVRLQTWFMEAVTNAPAATAPSIECAEAEQPAAVAERVLPSRFLSAVERVGIYRDAYLSRLLECLRDDYPAVEHALGAQRFSALALSYIAAHPSRSPNLNRFGQHLSAFCRGAEAARSLRSIALAGDGDGSEANAVDALGFAADLAALEWALVEVLHAASPPPLSLDTLAALPPARWANARFVASPTLRVLATAFPANAYYQAFREEQAPRIPAARSAATAVFRDGATLWRMDLSPSMEALLSALMGGHSLGAALESLATSTAMAEDDGQQVMTWFRDWVTHGFFSAITVDPVV